MKNYDEIRKQAWQRIEALRAEKEPKDRTPGMANNNASAQDDHTLTNFDSKESLMEHLLGGI